MPVAGSTIAPCIQASHGKRSVDPTEKTDHAKEYLELERKAEIKSEYYDGQMYIRIVTNITFELENQFWTVPANFILPRCGRSHRPGSIRIRTFP
jgi:hypothetical protein